MPRPLKRSVTIKGHRTSVTLEPEFWSALETIAARHGRPLGALIAEIDIARAATDPDQSLSSALRVFVLETTKRERGT